MRGWIVMVCVRVVIVMVNDDRETEYLRPKVETESCRRDRHPFILVYALICNFTYKFIDIINQVGTYRGGRN